MTRAKAAWRRTAQAVRRCWRRANRVSMIMLAGLLLAIDRAIAATATGPAASFGKFHPA